MLKHAQVYDNILHWNKCKSVTVVGHKMFVLLTPSCGYIQNLMFLRMDLRDIKNLQTQWSSPRELSPTPQGAVYHHPGWVGTLDQRWWFGRHGGRRTDPARPVARKQRARETSWIADAGGAMFTTTSSISSILAIDIYS